MSSRVADRLTFRGDIVVLTSQFDRAHKNTEKGGGADGGKIFPILWSWDNTYNAFTTLYIPGMVTDIKLFLRTIGAVSK